MTAWRCLCMKEWGDPLEHRHEVCWGCCGNRREVADKAACYALPDKAKWRSEGHGCGLDCVGGSESPVGTHFYMALRLGSSMRVLVRAHSSISYDSIGTGYWFGYKKVYGRVKFGIVGVRIAGIEWV